jgi:hypothetical protein
MNHLLLAATKSTESTLGHRELTAGAGSAEADGAGLRYFTEHTTELLPDAG